MNRIQQEIWNASVYAGQFVGGLPVWWLAVRLNSLGVGTMSGGKEYNPYARGIYRAIASTWLALDRAGRTEDARRLEENIRNPYDC